MKLKNERLSIFNSIPEKMVMIFPEWLFGSEAEIAKHCREGYVPREGGAIHHVYQKKTAKAYLALTILLFLLLLPFMKHTFQGEIDVFEIERPKFGFSKTIQSLEAEISHNGEKIRKNITLQMNPMPISTEEKRQYVIDNREKIYEMILGENKDLQHVTTDLNLVETFGESGVAINWLSEAPDILKASGEIDWTKIGEDGRTLELKAIFDMEGINKEVLIPIQIAAPAKEDIKKSLAKKLEGVSLALEEQSRNEKNVLLPNTTDDGLPIYWREGKNKSPLLILTLFIPLYMIVFFRRFDGPKKESLEIKESIQKDLPDFVDKMTLLLYAGAFTKDAIIRITEDYEKYQTKEARKPLYEGLSRMKRKLEDVNSSLALELRDLAVSSGNRELMRIIAIMLDNLDKGVALAEKLEGEGAMLRSCGRKLAEEQGRIADTKLVFPMVMLLLSLLIITTGPIFNGL